MRPTLTPGVPPCRVEEVPHPGEELDAYIAYQIRKQDELRHLHQRPAALRMRLDGDIKRKRADRRLADDLCFGIDSRKLAFVVGDVNFAHNGRGTKSTPAIRVTKVLMTFFPVSSPPLLSDKWRICVFLYGLKSYRRSFSPHLWL